METQNRDLLEIWNAFQVTTLFNQYVLENVAVGKLSPKDKIPYDRFIEELRLKSCMPYSFRNQIEGIAITEGETVRDRDIEFFLKEYFVSRMNFVFESAPKISLDLDDDGLYHYSNDFNEFIKGLYPIYREILLTEVTPDFFDFDIESSDRSLTAYYEKLSEFVVAIKTHRLRKGRCVDCFVGGLPYLPVFIERLLKIQKNHYFLANSDTESIEYKLAVLSSMKFMNFEHARLFEMKMLKWAQS